jgi:hypothetical protein
MSNNLGISREAEAQANPHVPQNDAAGEVDALLSEGVAIGVTSINAYSVSDAELDSAVRFTIGNGGTSATAAFTISLPASSKRGLTLWINTLAYTATIQKTGGQSVTAPTVATGAWALIDYDGTNARLLTSGSGLGGAPTDADYLVKTTNGSLSAERVVTDTTYITWDWATAGQAKATFEFEAFQDIVGAMVTSGTGVAMTYNDGSGQILADLDYGTLTGDTPVGADLIAFQKNSDNSHHKSTLSALGASATDALTGTNSVKFVTADALAALWEKGGDEASAGTVSFGEGGYFHVTGTTTITDIDMDVATNGRAVVVQFDAALTLTHNATTLVLPTGANIVTVAGDTACFVQDAADNIKCVWYQRADGTALAGGISGALASTTETLTGTNNSKAVTPDSLAALWEAGTDIADGATITIGEGGYFNLITSTTAITAFTVTTDKAGRTFRARFNTVRTLTHNATSLILPTAANITTAVGDIAQVRSLGGGNVVVEFYSRADGTALVGSVSGSAATTTEQLTGTSTSKASTPDSVAALWEKGSNIASAGTISIAEGGLFHITGTTTITDIDFAVATDGRGAWLIFDGVLTITHHATTLVLPGGANITTAAGDMAYVTQDSGDNIKVAFFPISGRAVTKTIESFVIACSDEATALTTGTAKVTFRMPYAFTVTAVRASVTTAPTGGTLLTVDINEGGSTILSTKLTFDASEKTTTTAATAAVISDSTLADDAEITIDIDAVGSTIAGAGLKVYIIGHQ